MPTGPAYGLLAAAGWGVVDIAGALAARRVGGLRVQMGTLVVGVLSFPVFTLLRPDLLGPDPLPGVLLGLPLGIFAAAGYIAYMTALRLGPISVVSPIAVSYGGLSVILAVVVRGESLSGLQAAGALLAAFGVALASIVLGEGTLRSARIVGPGVAMALLTVVLFAIVQLGERLRPIQWIGLTALACGLGVLALAG